MKLSIVLLIVGMLQVSASVYSQKTKFNFEAEQTQVLEVLKQIEESSDFHFFFIREQVDVQRMVSISAEDATVEEILNDMFEDQGISYQILDDGMILLVPKIVQEEAETRTQTQQITGKVIDSDGQLLPGVTVMVKGTNNGTITGANGEFSISGINKGDILVFSFIGMETTEMLVEDQTSISVSLGYEAIDIGEVVAIGYGTVKKADLTGAVSTVSADELIKISTTNTAQAIQGRMTGVQVTQSNGEPGSGSIIKIRGIGSLKSDNSPLIMIDGFAGSLSDVNPHDIASISVLKDASAASIYGARAANGVILVTTKRGIAGKVQVEFTAEHGVSSLTKRPEFLNAEEFATKMNEDNIWNGRQPIWKDEFAPENLGEGTDWWDYVYKKGAFDKYHLGIRGGTEATKYALSVGYFNEDGLIDNTSYNKIQTRFNFDHRFNKWLSVGANYDLSRSKKFNGNENIWGDGIGYNGYGLGIAAHRSSPTVPAYFDDGSLGIYRIDVPGERPGNGTLPPTWYYGNKDKNDSYLNNRISLFAELTILDGLKYKSVFNGYQGSSYKTHWNGTWEAFYPDSEIVAQANTRNGLSTSSSSTLSWEIQQLLTYEKQFGNHQVSALAGYSVEKMNSEWMSHTVQGFPGNELHVADAGSELMNFGGSGRITAYESFFGRFNYDYAGKYLIQGTVRHDGSSAFAPGYQYGTFPSISGAWKINRENFMKNIKQISNLKIRVGYGQLGNAKIPSYKWLSSLSLTDGHPFGSGFPQSFQPAYYYTDIPNKEVKWETTTTLDIGLDLGLYRNRLTFEFDYYNKSTTDLLWPATVPETAGFIEGPMVNIGEVSNIGWEITAGWDDHIGNIAYGLNVNMSHNENMVVDMGGIPEQLNGNVMVKEGYPINSYWGYKVDGIWETWEELENNVHREGDIRPGDYRYLNIGGPDDVDGQTSMPDTVINSFDMTYLGDAIPDFYYGLSGYIEFKGIDFSFLLNGELGKQSMIEPVYGGGYSGGNVIVDYYNSRAILDESGEVISGTTNATGADAGGGSQAAMHDLSYMRIKNLQLGYTLPQSLTAKIKVSSIRIYVNATNPFIFTNYVGWDQETTAITSGQVNRGGNQYVPTSKILSMGLSVKF
ncbi:MAG: SusC/RagA family TonB-linked outer membrane protein [Bacteroides sp.]|nr:SusC/RagA family TonB-linked outer membrane protein [Bacteroides sp.]